MLTYIYVKFNLHLHTHTLMIKINQHTQLKNGRLAMVGSMGLLVQEYITGENPIEALIART